MAGLEVGLLNLHFFNICRHHPTLKIKPHATDDERYVLGIDGVPLKSIKDHNLSNPNGLDQVIAVGLTANASPKTTYSKSLSID